MKLMPAVLSLRSRVLFWLFVLLVFELLGLAGRWPHASLRPPAPESSSGTGWPVFGLIVLRRAVVRSAGSSRATACCRDGRSSARRS